MKSVLSLMLTSMLFFACSNVKTIEPVDNNVIPAGLTEKQIVKAIELAGASRGWVITESKDQKNTLIGQLNVRKHMLKVAIPYTQSNYKILYKDSAEMKYDASRNVIHRNYYRWVLNLKSDIDRELMVLFVNAK